MADERSQDEKAAEFHRCLSELTVAINSLNAAPPEARSDPESTVRRVAVAARRSLDNALDAIGIHRI
ncbi:MAG: hypothetical protein ACLQOZ_01785 [Acidimicrobiales bacterium]|jgi:hypothetical protein